MISALPEGEKQPLELHCTFRYISCCPINHKHQYVPSSVGLSPRVSTLLFSQIFQIFAKVRSCRVRINIFLLFIPTSGFILYFLKSSWICKKSCCFHGRDVDFLTPLNQPNNHHHHKLHDRRHYDYHYPHHHHHHYYYYYYYYYYY